MRRLWGTREEQDQRERGQRANNKNMNMKQEGPFLVPQLWKDAMNLENITNDFLDSNNVTGEVMNLDDFLKELQVNELVEHAEANRRGQTPGASQMGHGAPDHPDQRSFQPLIRPTNIEALKEHHHPSNHALVGRPSVMHHVGKAPDLHMLQSPGQGGPSHMGGDHMGEGGVSLPHRDMQGMHMASVKDQGGQGGGHGIPQASVRPQVRPMPMVDGKVEPMHGDLHQRMDLEPKQEHSKRMRKMSEESEFDEDEDEGHDGNGQKFGGFTSTVCVNFSQDDLRLATIPGQEGDFDPATRRFSEEELKPQPIIRKRKKQFVPDELKNNKYWAKRCKNNEAAKRSREARRLKENQIAMRARFLEEENTALKGEVEHLKKENSDLKQMMMALEDKLNSMVENR